MKILPVDFDGQSIRRVFEEKTRRGGFQLWMWCRC
jgi:hypothetical protein